jgi:hypothetical protein
MNQLIILEKIAIIERSIEEIKASFLEVEFERTSPNVIQWDYCLRDHTKSFILTLVSKFGYNQKISRKDKFIKEQLWQHRLTDFAQILNTLQERKFCKIESYVGDSNRIEYFSFIKP